MTSPRPETDANSGAMNTDRALARSGQDPSSQNIQRVSNEPGTDSGHTESQAVVSRETGSGKDSSSPNNEDISNGAASEAQENVVKEVW